jgi:hypothetical protein
VTAIIALTGFNLDRHILAAMLAENTRVDVHITALQACVQPVSFVPIQKDVAAALGTTLNFPFEHFIHLYHNHLYPQH